MLATIDESTPAQPEPRYTLRTAVAMAVEHFVTMNPQQQIEPLPAPPPVYRWAVLAFVSLAMFGNYYVYDALGPVIDLMREQLDFSYRQIGLLSTAYNIAALLVLLAGGVFIDRFGTKKAISLFALICLAAAILTAIRPRYEGIGQIKDVSEVDILADCADWDCRSVKVSIS